MSDYFNNLVVRSFRPLLPAQPLEAGPGLAPIPGDHYVPPPSTPEDFQDPFAEAIAADQLTDEQAQASAPRDPTRKKNTELRRPILKDRERPEPAFEEDRRPKMPTRSVGNSPGRGAVPSNNQLTPNSSEETLPKPERKPTGNAGPLLGKPLQPPPGEAHEASRPTSSILASDVTHSEFRPSTVKRSPERNPLLPFGASPQQSSGPKRSSAPGPGARPSFKRAAASTLGHDIPTSATERAVFQRMTETIEMDQPTAAPLTTLIPRPGSELLFPQTHNGPLTLWRPSAPVTTGAEVPPSETIINVSIGRIEIRATPPKTASHERERRSPQLMNLDEYLRQRSGGRR